MKPNTQRCPVCEHVSLTREDNDDDYQFVCKNPKCNVTVFGDNWFSMGYRASCPCDFHARIGDERWKRERSS